MSRFTRLYFKSHSFYPRKRRRFSPGLTDAAGRADPPIILSDGRISAHVMFFPPSSCFCGIAHTCDGERALVNSLGCAPP